MKEFERLALAEALSEISMAIRDIASFLPKLRYNATSIERDEVARIHSHCRLASLAAARLDVPDCDLGSQLVSEQEKGR